ncbi:TRM11 family SAM-dependent methyltransferase [Sporosarcina sp. G11-34]|uniref:TRM11 family SAM-dependent methyltransferase n=1 Tax=Sporosarcina sp. G11-34 TaxID=2849605 RepID=UPI003FA6B8C6
MSKKNQQSKFIYTYAYHGDEEDLCRMEMRAFFGFDSQSNVVKSNVQIVPSRSPFMKDRIKVLYESDHLAAILEQLQQIELNGKTFKVTCLNTIDLGSTKKIGYEKRRAVERDIGMHIDGEPDFENPQIEYAIALIDEQWVFGKHMQTEPIWFHHQKKPHSYSIALNTRVARAVANIAVPHPDGVRAIDPCCGIGTVLIEALSMGIHMVGRDINYQIVEGTKKNLIYFGYVGDVVTGPISEVTTNYDVAVIDMPYNHFSHISPEDQQSIITNARRFSKKVVVVTIENMDAMIEKAGFKIIDRGEARKGNFVREILICE